MRASLCYRSKPDPAVRQCSMKKAAAQAAALDGGSAAEQQPGLTTVVVVVTPVSIPVAGTAAVVTIARSHVDGRRHVDGTRLVIHGWGRSVVHGAWRRHINRWGRHVHRCAHDHAGHTDTHRQADTTMGLGNARSHQTGDSDGACGHQLCNPSGSCFEHHNLLYLSVDIRSLAAEKHDKRQAGPSSTMTIQRMRHPSGWQGSLQDCVQMHFSTVQRSMRGHGRAPRMA